MNSLPWLGLLTAAAPQAAEQQILDLDNTVFVILGLFLLLAVLLTQYLWKPYLQVKTERTTRVEGYREQAARMDADAEARLRQIDTQLAQARREGSAALAQARTEAQAREQVLVAEAVATAQAQLAEARGRIEQALATQRAAAQGRAAELGRRAAERVLGRPVVS